MNKKSNQRKKLEMQAIILGFTVTYGEGIPSHSKIGDRFYCTREGKYYIAGKKPHEALRLLHGMTEWYSVGSKRFFNTSDIID